MRLNDLAHECSLLVWMPVGQRSAEPAARVVRCHWFYRSVRYFAVNRSLNACRALSAVGLAAVCCLIHCLTSLLGQLGFGLRRLGCEAAVMSARLMMRAVIG